MDNNKDAIIKENKSYQLPGQDKGYEFEEC